jgi:hypothetical protein
MGDVPKQGQCNKETLESGLPRAGSDTGKKVFGFVEQQILPGNTKTSAT